jgi:pimeloyl-ACP methyl ester carboxylesterase
MRTNMKYLVLMLLSSLLTACSSAVVTPLNTAWQIYVPGLSPCDGQASTPLTINHQLPLVVLVHGCNASAGSFNKLSEVLALQNQQSVCFVYDDRDSLVDSAQALNKSLAAVAKHLDTPQITLLGHSQGGLISRKASTLSLEENIAVDLVTVSAPLSGIKAAQYCGKPVIRVATLGIHDLVCWLVSGDKWYEITDASDFIKRPGKLDNSIKSHLLIATDERNTCRVMDDNNQCVEDDYVFSLNEQILPQVHNDLVVTKVKLKAGHVEIVGNENMVPYKLIQALQDNHVIKTVAKVEQQAFYEKLQKIYKLANVDLKQ